MDQKPELTNGYHSKQQPEVGTDKSVRISLLTDHNKPAKQDDMKATSLLVVPPDGGYGWVILFASFMVNLIVDGVCFTFGIFFVKFNEYYGEGEAKTAWVGSILNGMYLSMGPISGALANRYGCRKVTIVGSIIACFAFFISTFSSNINVLILTYGVLGGMGFGLMYLPAIVMVGFYFEKRRAFATGVAVCGSGIGGFLFAPLMNYLVTEYGWKGATWITAGLVLNGAVMGALFQPLTVPNDSEEDNMIQTKVPLPRNGDQRPQKRTPAIRRLTESDGHDHFGDESINGVGSGVNSGVGVGSLKTLRDNQLYEHKAWRSVSHIESDGQMLQKHRTSECSLLKKRDIFYSGSMHHLQESESRLNSHMQTEALSDCCESDTMSSNGFAAFLRSMKSMTDFSMLKDPVFCVYGLSCFLCMAGFFVPFIYLPSIAKDLNISSENAAFLISIIGITNTVARIITGWVSDQPWSDCLIINNCALIIGGISTMLCPYCYTYNLLSIYAMVFGSSIAAFVSLRSIIMVELMGLERLTNAFGLVTMCQGFSSFIGAPIAGAIKEVTGDFTIPFYMAGGCMVLAGIICMPLRRIARKQRESRARSNNARSDAHAFSYTISGEECIERDVVIEN